ncbi:sodium-dependent glucose transporter 1 [Plakobranchus ocellatus]|uniref:Sodium-dependent glucose transporter 1 n=1 Tax=Plakobranchus ocellatus TaxID=259542 RepID=A0AAV4AX47_9GAST|nr:sodium-dependent glucose transporter 1 [Plakobranchus ocellatus]
MSASGDDFEKYHENNIKGESLLPVSPEIGLHEGNGYPVLSPGDDGHRIGCSNRESGLSDSDLKDESATNCPEKLNFISDFRRKFQEDAFYRRNLKHSLCLAIALFGLGVVEAQSGPTFLDLQIITGTNVGQASAFFTAHSCGYLLGSTASGYISGRKINASLALLMSLLAMGIAVIILPYCSLYVTMIAIRGLTGVFGGFIDTTANAEQMRIWGRDGPVLMQLLHFCFALGGVVSPLVTEPFLAVRSDDRTAGLHHNSDTDGQRQTSPIIGSVNHKDQDSINNMSLEFSVTSSSFIPAKNSSYYPDSTPIPDENSRSTNVHWAFLITGLVVIVASTPFFFLYNKSRRAKRKAKRSQSDKDAEKESLADDATTSQYRKIPFSTHILLVAGLCAFYIFYCCVEDTFANFLMTFVVRRFRTVSKSDGAHITAVYWGSFAASRFLMIFVSRALSPVRVLYLGGSLMLISFSGFTLSSGAWVDGGFGDKGLSSLSTPTNNSPVANLSTAEWDPFIAGDKVVEQGDVPGSIPALIFFTAMAGLGMSGVFPAGLSWSGAELLKVTGRVSSFIFVSASLGAMLNPLLVSRLMQDWSNLWFCYVLLLEVTALALVFVGLLALNRCYINKKYGKLHRVCQVDIGIPANDLVGDGKDENSVGLNTLEPRSDSEGNKAARHLLTKDEDDPC